MTFDPCNANKSKCGNLAVTLVMISSVLWYLELPGVINPGNVIHGLALSLTPNRTFANPTAHAHKHIYVYTSSVVTPLCMMCQLNKFSLGYFC